MRIVEAPGSFSDGRRRHFPLRVPLDLRPKGVDVANPSFLPKRENLLISNAEQKRVLSMVKDGQIIPDKWRELFSWYAKSDMFRAVLRSKDSDSLVSLDVNENFKPKDDFAGRVFEDIAFIYAAVKFAKYIVLSPKETLDVFSGIYSGARIVNFPFGKESIAGVSVPDGLVIDPKTGKVLKILEFSLVKREDSIGRKISRFKQRRRKLNRDFGGSTLLFVMPQTNPVSEQIRNNGASVSLYQLPFSRRLFRNFVNQRFVESVLGKGKQ